ncbi:MAG: GNAT family N-acetyltransferase [Clostridium sp.]
MKTIETCILTETQKNEIQSLLEAGSAKNGEPVLAFPLEEASRFFLLYDPELVCTLALLLPEKDPDIRQSEEPLPEAECIAYTHPNLRKKGYFSSLLSLASPWIQNRDVLFPVSPHFPDTPLALEAIGAERISTEYRMEINLKKYCPDQAVPNADWAPGRLTLQTENTLENGFQILTFHFFLVSSASPAASSRIFFEAAASKAKRGCLCDFEVLPGLRGLGLGKEALLLMLLELKSFGKEAVFLHVSGDNIPAISLYQKTGFRISETLSYYLY